MANELVTILSRRNQVGITSGEFQLFNPDGSTLATLAAVEIPGEAVYRASMPAGAALGCYAYRLQLSATDQPLSFGQLYWDGTQRVSESEFAIITQGVASISAITSLFTSVQTQLTNIVDEIGNKQGLTDSQLAILTFVRDVAEADEVLTPTQARKLLKGTETVLVDKDVVSSTQCVVNTSIREALT